MHHNPQTQAIRIDMSILETRLPSGQNSQGTLPRGVNIVSSCSDAQKKICVQGACSRFGGVPNSRTCAQIGNPNCEMATPFWVHFASASRASTRDRVPTRGSEKKSDIFRPISRQTAQKGAEKQCRTACAAVVRGGRS